MQSSANFTSVVHFFAHKHGYSVNYYFNERILGPRCGAVPPPNGCEICIRNLPPSMFEDFLYFFFVSAGNIYKMRLVLNRNQNFNVGTAYITFDTPMGAKKALAFNKTEIYPGFIISVVLSNDNRRLYVSGIPKEVRKEEVWMELIKIGIKGVVDVIMYKSYTDRNKNRGYVFVEFPTHQVARSEFSKLNCSLLFGLRITASWANTEPNSQRSEDQSRTLHLRNMNGNEPPNIMREFLQITLGDDALIERVFKKNDYAFVTFQTRRDAQKAMEVLKSHFSGQNINVIVNWARPKLSMAARRAAAQNRPQLPPITNGSNETNGRPGILGVAPHNH